MQGLGRGLAGAINAAAWGLSCCHGASLCRGGGGFISRSAIVYAGGVNRVGRAL